jgi:integrase
MPANSTARIRPAPKPFLHRATGQAAVKIRGRFYYLGKHGSEAAREAYRRILRDVWAKPAVEPPAGLTPAQIDRLTIVDLLTAYWQHADRYYVKDGKPTSTIAGIAPALRLLREKCGDQLAAEFGPLKLQALRECWIHDGHLARTTINHYASYVKRVFYWAAKNELVPASVAHALRFVDHLAAGRTSAPESDPVTAVDDELVEATLPHLPPIVADMVRFQRLTGARPGEVCRLRADQVKRYADPKPKQLRKSASRPLFPDELPPRGEKLDVWEYRPPGHKTVHRGKQRVIFIGPRAQAIVDEYLARAGDGKCFPYTVGSYRRAIARACVRAFMPKRLRSISRKLPAEEQAALKSEAAAWRRAHVWSPNQLRHSAATAMSAQYGDIDAARVVLGHGTQKTTEVYSARDLAKARDIAREVG